jgi:hypothetical protein
MRLYLRKKVLVFHTVLSIEECVRRLKTLLNQQNTDSSEITGEYENYTFLLEKKIENGFGDYWRFQVILYLENILILPYFW